VTGAFEETWELAEGNVDAILKDIRFGLRTLAKSPGFTAVAVVILALGIGANTAIFSLTDQVLLRLLPVRDPRQLVVLRSPGPKRGHTSDDGDEAASFSYPLYRDLRDHNVALSGLLARYSVALSVSFKGQTERAAGELVSGNYFEVLGVPAALGRTFTQDDDRVAGGHPLAVLSYSYWNRRFASDPAVLNQTLLINGHLMTVVGVSRAGFFGVQVGKSPDIFIPITMKAQMTPNWDGLEDRKDHWLAIIGRLKPGVSRQQAEVSTTSLMRSILQDEVKLATYSNDQREKFLHRAIILESGGRGRPILQSEVGAPLVALAAMVGLVLMIACTNVANLLLARGAFRQREFAIRLAMGAGRGRLVRQLLSESLLLSLLGGGLGLVAAAWTTKALLKSLSASQGIMGLSADLDYRILGFSLTLTLLTGVLFGLLPALRSTRPDLAETLKDQSAKSSSGRGQVSLRRALVVGQVALTLLLLLGAGLFAKSIYNLSRVDLGLSADRVITFSVAPALSAYSPEATLALAYELRRNLSSLPGVRSASAATVPILAGDDEGSNLTVDGYRVQPDEDLHVLRNEVGPDFFSTLGIPLISGREFGDRDTAASPRVAIINETLARRVFAGRNPIGGRMAFGAGTNLQFMEVVGVVKDSKHENVRDAIRPFVYTPYSQKTGLGRLTFYIRTAQAPDALAGALRAEVQRLAPNVPVFDLVTLEEQIHESLYTERMLAGLSTSFGLLAALLSAVGIFGLMSYLVAQRTREIGIRMALGARRWDVSRMILSDVGKMAAIGVALGLPAALGLGHYVQALLYGVQATDFVLMAAAIALVAAIALLAGYFPAHSASRMDPLVALREE
jgi:predicted permease